jgi:uroporphyrin-III C-methyltransferase
LSKLYLIGAGPGDPELLTLKAVRLLGECDVILYDRLVNPELLRFANPRAELIYIGKHEGEQERVQSRIFDLILQFARQGKTVGRLKGGDPLVFGRGAEEWELARRHAIEVELVPGVSSAIAVPGLARIPLTYRGISQSFVIVTAHCHEGSAEDWSKYQGIDTLVVLMGVKNREFVARSLIAGGRRAEEPAAFIERGSLPGERVVESTLAEIAAGKCQIESPAILVIGEVVRLRGRLGVNESIQELPVFADSE